MERDRSLKRLLWTAAGVTLGLGLMLTARSLTGLARDRDRYDKRLTDLRAVDSLAQTVAARDAALQTWSRTDASVRPLAEILRTQGPDAAAVIRDLESASGPAGWQIRRTSVVLTNVGYDRLADTARLASAARPPWTLAECVLQASERPGIAARMELVFETAERSGK